MSELQDPAKRLWKTRWIKLCNFQLWIAILCGTVLHITGRPAFNERLQISCNKDLSFSPDNEIDLWSKHWNAFICLSGEKELRAHATTEWTAILKDWVVFNRSIENWNKDYDGRSNTKNRSPLHELDCNDLSCQKLHLTWDQPGFNNKIIIRHLPLFPALAVRPTLCT